MVERTIPGANPDLMFSHVVKLREEWEKNYMRQQLIDCLDEYFEWQTEAYPYDIHHKFRLILWVGKRKDAAQ
jgi:hypothetical protein